MSTPIHSLNLTTRAKNCLLAEDIDTVEKLSEFIRMNGKNGLLRIPNLGRKWADEIMRFVQSGEAEAKPKKPRRASSREQITMRDYFAARAMPTVISDWLGTGDIYQDAEIPEVIARDCYLIADAMLAAREVKND